MWGLLGAASAPLPAALPLQVPPPARLCLACPELAGQGSGSVCTGRAACGMGEVRVSKRGGGAVGIATPWSLQALGDVQYLAEVPMLAPDQTLIGTPVTWFPLAMPWACPLVWQRATRAPHTPPARTGDTLHSRRQPALGQSCVLHLGNMSSPACDCTVPCRHPQCPPPGPGLDEANTGWKERRVPSSAVKSWVSWQQRFLLQPC